MSTPLQDQNGQPTERNNDTLDTEPCGGARELGRRPGARRCAAGAGHVGTVAGHADDGRLGAVAAGLAGGDGDGGAGHDDVGGGRRGAAGDGGDGGCCLGAAGGVSWLVGEEGKEGTWRGKGEKARREDVRCGSRDCEGDESELHFGSVCVFVFGVCVCECMCLWQMERGYKREQRSTLYFETIEVCRKEWPKPARGRSYTYTSTSHPPPPHTYLLHTHSHTYAAICPSGRHFFHHCTPTTRHATPRHDDRKRNP
jgi:hypothetical protein